MSERDIEGFRFLEQTTFTCGAVTNTVAVYQHDRFARVLSLSESARDARAEFVLIEGGTFTMGMPDEVINVLHDLSVETEGGLEVMRPAREVTVEPFLIARTPLTQEVWDGIGKELDRDMGDQRYTESPYLPIHGVSHWWYTELAADLGVQLPTEAEWEFAARGGSGLTFFFGDHAQRAFEYGWYGHAHEGGPMGVAQKKANAFGLYDIVGNVWELCEDWWFDDHTGAPTDASPRTGEPENDPLQRVIRGGSYRSDTVAHLLSAFRSSAGIYYAGDDLGVRPVVRL